MRFPVRLGLNAATAITLALVASTATAGPIADENARTEGVTSHFLVDNDGSAATADGVVDVYPDHWSVAVGTPVHLRIRSVGAGYGVELFRVGWYGGQGARAFTPAAGITGAADPQAYPTPDARYGLAPAAWHDSVTIDTTALVPGVYVARVTQNDSSARQAETFFVVRDDTLATKQPFVFVIGLNTHEAYNAWPGMARGGKSLYAWNSSAAPVKEANAAVRKGQAVKVSFDRPFLVGGGTADVFRWEYPMIRWLEKSGWEVAYAVDRDLDTTPNPLNGRLGAIYSGHDEYWTGQMFTNALAARDSGVSMLFVSGDTISWQVRFEDAGQTMVGFKENWPNDPMNKTNPDLVSRGFKTLPHPRPAIQLTGVMSSGQIKDATGAGKDFPYADWIVTNATHWIFAGTTLTKGSMIKSVMGYEVDSCSLGVTGAEFDPYRPAGQVPLGVITQPWDGVRKGSSCYYQKALGGGKNVEVIGIGSMAFTWALDDFAEKQGYPKEPTTVDPNAQQMMTNVLSRWAKGPPPTWSPDGGLDDAGTDPTPTNPEDSGVGDALGGGDAPIDPGGDAIVIGPDGAPLPDGGSNPGASPGSSSSGCGCRIEGAESEGRSSWSLAGVAVAIASIAITRRRRR